MTCCQSFLLIKNGSLNLKQLTLITETNSENVSTFVFINSITYNIWQAFNILQLIENSKLKSDLRTVTKRNVTKPRFRNNILIIISNKSSLINNENKKPVTH